jgi:Rieske Fe-S protein
MEVNRRQFVILSVTAAAGLCSACSSDPAAEVSARKSLATVTDGPVDAGPLTAYAADGVYETFAGRGFFVVRRGEKLSALSSVCTHRKCPLFWEADGTFLCHCHGSTFSREGKVLEGPAKRDLPTLASMTDADGHLIVTVMKP